MSVNLLGLSSTANYKMATSVFWIFQFAFPQNFLLDFDNLRNILLSFVQCIILRSCKHTDQMLWLMKTIVFSSYLIAQEVKYANLHSSSSWKEQVKNSRNTFLWKRSMLLSWRVTQKGGCLYWQDGAELVQTTTNLWWLIVQCLSPRRKLHWCFETIFVAGRV